MTTVMKEMLFPGHARVNHACHSPDDHPPARHAVGFTFPRDLHQFAFDQPGGAVTHAWLAASVRGMEDRVGFESALVVANLEYH